MNFSSLAKAATAAGSVLKDVQSKAKDALHEAQDAQRRVTQHALEAAGMADKTEDDDALPELKAHMRVDASLRKLYKHTDAYLRAVNAMNEASKALADDFAEALEPYPALSDLASSYVDGHHAAMAMQMQVLGQTLHRKVFTPIRKEVEGRKDLDKRLADRKKVRLDYDAYRRKQQQSIVSDPDNRQMYEANLQNAQQTFAKHTALVSKDLSAVSAERDAALSGSFMAFAVAETAFHADMGAQLKAAASFAATPAAAERFSAMVEAHAAIRKQVRASPPPSRSSSKEKTESATQPSAASASSTPPVGQQPRASPPRRRRSYRHRLCQPIRLHG